jgi:hypothetical protein
VDSRLKVVGFLVAAVAAASMWFYVDRILVGYQVADAAAHERPRGNLSDLYPRWLGARELLLHGRNPYSDEVAVEIQKGYYGRALDEARPNDPKDRQGFAYPVYVVFLLAPLIGLPFHGVQIFFHWLLLGLTVASVGLWLRVLRWRPHGLAIAAAAVLMVGSFPAVQGIKLQQLSLLVAALLAGAAACVASGFLFCGGMLLALATIKPQLAWPMVAWLLLWAMSDWRARRRFVLGFGIVMAALLAGAEVVLPGWWRMFADAIAQYHQYTQNQSVLQVLLSAVMGSAGGGSVSRICAEILAVIAVLVCGTALWKLRTKSADDGTFGRAAGLAMALTVVIVPMSSPYNQVLLLPAILALVRESAWFLRSSSVARRMAYWVGVLVVGWQWVASLSLTGIFLFVSQARAFEGWKWPFFATFAIPVIVFGLMFMEVRRTRERE